MKRNHTDKKGAISIVALFIAAFVMVMGFLFTVDLPLKLIQQNQLKDTSENAAKAAVTFLDQTALQQGYIQFNQVKAEEAVYRLIAESYDLELASDFTNNPEPFTKSSLESRRIKTMKVNIAFIDIGKEDEKKSNNPKQNNLNEFSTDGFIPEIQKAIWEKNKHGEDIYPKEVRGVNTYNKHLIYDGIAVNIQATYMKTFDLDFNPFRFGQGDVEVQGDLELSRVSIAQARIQKYNTD